MPAHVCNRVISEILNNLQPIREQYSAPIPADYVREAINDLDNLGGFHGPKLPVSRPTPLPDRELSYRLCAKLRIVYMNLLNAGISPMPTKQDIQSVFPDLEAKGLIVL